MSSFDARAQPAAGPAIHRYACLRCRLRRVKCDKVLTGCTHCASHGAQCVCSARRPRKSNKESQVHRGQRSLLPASSNLPILLSAKVVLENEARASEHSTSDEEDTIIVRELRDGLYEASKDRDGGIVVGPPGNPEIVDGEGVKQTSSTSRDRWSKEHHVANVLGKQHGRKLSSLRMIIGHDLRTNRPPPTVMLVLWDHYSRHVDRMAKVLYKPVVQVLVTREVKDINSIKAVEAPLLFAIWLAAAISLSAEECQHLNKEEKTHLTRRYRRSVEDALVSAGWMTTQNILVLQSLTIYLFFTSECSQSTWILNGIALSIAQTMGLQSESTSASTSIIETEICRRVWWTLCQIDVRISANCSLESHVPHTTTTPLPLHINDTDLELFTQISTLTERNEFTDVTLALVKMKATKITLRFQRSTMTREKKEKIVNDQLKRRDDTYLKYFDANSELHKICKLGTRFIMMHLWKMLYDAFSEPHPLYDDEIDVPESLIVYNTDVLEIAHQLPCRYKQYGWSFRCKYTQWHALAYLLIQMWKYTQGAAVDRAWSVLDAVFADCKKIGITSRTGNGQLGKKTVSKLWKPLLVLFERAREARKRGLQLSNAFDTPSTLSTGYATTDMTPESLQQHFLARDVPLQHGLIGDPFLGSVDDLGPKMNWEQLDEWAKSFQDGYEQQKQQNAVSEDQDMIGGLNWW